jgi:hypothetical protein
MLFFQGKASLFLQRGRFDQTGGAEANENAFICLHPHRAPDAKLATINVFGGSLVLASRASVIVGGECGFGRFFMRHSFLPLMTEAAIGLGVDFSVSTVADAQSVRKLSIMSQHDSKS